MSGPKDSSYYLAEAERKRQERERQQRLEDERCGILDERIAERKADLAQALNRITKKTNEKTREFRILLNDNITIDRIEKSLERLTRLVGQLPDNYEARKSDVMSGYLVGLDKILSEITAYEYGTFPEYTAILTSDIEQRRQLNAELELLSDLKKVNRQDQIKFDLTISNVISQSPDPVANPTGNIAKVDYQVSVVELYSLLNSYIGNDFLQNKSDIEGLKQSVQQIIDNPRLDDKYKLEQIQTRRKIFLNTRRVYDQEIERNRQEYEDLYLTYLSLSSMLKSENIEFVKNYSNITALRIAVEKMQLLLKQKEESEYIAQSVNEVMEELGYDIVAADILTRPNRNVIHNIFEFDQGNVINVFTSDNGSIMFEVTGVKETNDLTELEKLKIKESMDQFCSKYQLIKDKLEARGIKLAAENLRPADIKYAKAINMSSKKQTKTRKESGSAKNPAKAVQRHVIN